LSHHQEAVLPPDALENPTLPVARKSDTAILFAVATVVALLHILTNNRYGFHRDELQVLSDARHLDWGFVAYPPLTPFIERIAFSLFGLSLVGLRLFSVLAQAVLIFISGLMARDLGGGRFSQVTTALAVALSPLPIFEATEFQYTSFGMLWWVLVCWFTIRLLTSDNPRWCLAIGAAIGLGLLTKYSVVFFVAGLLVGLVLSRARRHFLSPWFWAGTGVAFLLFFPNLVWLIRHDWISYHFLQHIHMRDVGEGRAEGYWKLQFLLDLNLAAIPLAFTGLIAFFRHSRYRMLAWMYVVPVLAFWIGKGRFYYVAEAYPALIAMGAVVAVRWLMPRPAWACRTLATAFFLSLFAIGAYFTAEIVPVAASGRLRHFALAHNGDLREEIGWNELVRTVAQIRDSLPREQQAHLGIAVGNYGEAGAIEILGPAYHLPPPISTVNSFWFRGYPTPQPTTIILLGNSRERANELFTNCRLAGHNGNSEGIRNEESVDHPDIFVCGPPRNPWQALWQNVRDFG
jgi:hypothetical protein